MLFLSQIQGFCAANSSNTFLEIAIPRNAEKHRRISRQVTAIQTILKGLDKDWAAEIEQEITDVIL